jgi:5-methylcytosine-specific restriction enzyme subunit McrC
MPDVDIFQWKEYEPVRYPPGVINDIVGNALYSHFRNHVSVEFPTPKTDGKWEFTPLGWVGTIPVIDSIVISIAPKAPLESLFRMWEYAYRLKGTKFLDGVINCQSIAEFYQNLAGILANQVLDRTRQGLYRSYLGREDRLPYVSGRLDVRRLAFEPWRADLHCAYEEHTADIEENQILCWTLSVIARSGLCTDRVLSKVRRAYRELTGCTSLMPMSPKSCIGRLYNRLNEDYKPLHGLCRFFLEHSGPTQNQGDNAMTPFLMDMGRLYELFVAEWLKMHLPSQFELKVQHTASFGAGDELQFRIDLVLLHRNTSTPFLILDTKYKVPDCPSSTDIHQVRSYAEALSCGEAILVYPIKLPKAMDITAGNIRVRTLTFAVKGDIELAGHEFLYKLLPSGQDIMPAGFNG